MKAIDVLSSLADRCSQRSAGTALVPVESAPQSSKSAPRSRFRPGLRVKVMAPGGKLREVVARWRGDHLAILPLPMQLTADGQASQTSPVTQEDKTSD